MKAVICERYGPPEVLQVKDIAKPVPRPHEVLIRVRATTVNSGDWRVRSMNVPPGFGFMSRLVLGLRGPRQRVLGTELAGEIEAIGAAVTKFKVGDRVLAFTGARMGCHAEYRTMPEDGGLALKPANLDDSEAAALCFGGTTALDFLRRGKLQPGEKVLINGASGAVGTAAVQLAKYMGAHVTGVCSSTNLDLVRSLGADRVIDYTQEDFTQGGERYDVIMDAAGTAPWSRSKTVLARGGRLLAVLGSLPELLQAPWVSLTSDRRVIAGPAAERPEDVRFLAELAAAGKYRPVIDSRYRFAQIVDAHRRVDSGHKRGSVVVTVA